MKQDTLEGKAKTKNGVKRLCFSIICILLEVIFIITIVTRLNEYAEIINLFTRILSGILVLGLYASDKTSSMKMPWVILILIFPIMGVGLYSDRLDTANFFVCNLRYFLLSESFLLFYSNTPDCQEALVIIYYQFLYIVHAFYVCHHSNQSTNTGLHP